MEPEANRNESGETMQPQMVAQEINQGGEPLEDKEDEQGMKACCQWSKFEGNTTAQAYCVVSGCYHCAP